MRKNKGKLFLVFLVILAAAGFAVKQRGIKPASNEIVTEITPVFGAVRNFISSTGTVLPKNRLEVKPPVNGRIEKILVREGDKVKTGQILAWMSSTERAALLDAARGKGEDTLQYWEGVYKPISLPAPIDAEVIVAKTQPGQTVSTSDAVVVLSDQLIVRAQVDETDIGKIRPNMRAVITLDAYPDERINASVEHLYYESKTVSNVTIYEVDLGTREAPAFFRSGMNANVDFIEQNKENILLVPLDAVHKEATGDYVFVRQNGAKEAVKRQVTLGISDDKNIEVISGIAENDRIVLKTKKYTLPRNAVGKNPFMPSRRR